ncbi:PREDICTED: SUN domain-containing protein 1 [Elephantulus edwardii]|uniref:SUN domain-containing protein 1 n=1 Tax=Elephantulus edwardii TaxID=28737 RepID=UPI0003F0AE40|nr:PREDICTED: SUN domain-containing protein 1 [Elephantulus edwardii]
MDFSRLHLYTPPQCVPENTGYTYALSSSYSSEALDFETEHRLDPVFDSPRMSRRSLRLVTPALPSGDGQDAEGLTCAQSSSSVKERVSRSVRQRRSAGKPTISLNHMSRKAGSSVVSRGGCRSLQEEVALRPPVLDASLIREQTKVDHFWGLDDDSDLKGGIKAASQGNGDLTAAVDTAPVNGYTCSDCSLLASRKDVLTTGPSALRPTSWIYSRDRSQKCGASYYVTRILWLAKRTSSSFSSFLIQLFQVVLMKLNCESENYRLKLYKSKDCESKSYESKALSGLAGGVEVTELLRKDVHLGVDGQPMWKVASGVFWWLGSGWYQFVTLISWLNVFLLTRCLRNVCKVSILLLPLLLLLGDLALWGQGGFHSLLPVLNWTSVFQMQRVDDPKSVLPPEASRLYPLPEGDGGDAWHWPKLSDVEQQVMELTGRCRLQDEKLRELTLLLQSLQARADQADTDRDGVLSLAALTTFHQNYELRISHLEDVIGKLTERSEAMRKELEESQQGTARTTDEQHLLSMVQQLELQLEQLKSELASWGQVQTSCERADSIHEQVDTQIRETVRLLFSEQLHGAPDWLLQTLSAQFVGKDELQALLRDLELQILRNVTHHLAVTHQAPTSEAVASAVHQAGVPGITEAQARVIVNNALKLYSQDKTGMVDFALESGGGSILSTRCSETYETKTALLSLFGIPLWYFSQSPRVVIQPDIYPGNCWAFRGSQGYLVVRLSMIIYPETFTLEHIPKTLSPTGNITSAPKDFAVYGLENEHQEEGLLLGQFTYDQDGESLQMFHTLTRPEKAFQIVELRIFSNWGHPEYTCLYRFRVHGEPIK